MITELSTIKDEDHWKKKLNDIRRNGSNRYSYDNYIVIKYDNGNTLR